jgi:hypothetical protein
MVAEDHDRERLFRATLLILFTLRRSATIGRLPLPLAPDDIG